MLGLGTYLHMPYGVVTQDATSDLLAMSGRYASTSLIQTADLGTERNDSESIHSHIPTHLLMSQV